MRGTGTIFLQCFQFPSCNPCKISRQTICLNSSSDLYLDELSVWGRLLEAWLALTVGLEVSKCIDFHGI